MLKVFGALHKQLTQKSGSPHFHEALDFACLTDVLSEVGRVVSDPVSVSYELLVQSLLFFLFELKGVQCFWQRLWHRYCLGHL